MYTCIFVVGTLRVFFQNGSYIVSWIPAVIYFGSKQSYLIDAYHENTFVCLDGERHIRFLVEWLYL